MILKYPKKNESIYKINPLLDNHEVFKVIGEYKMRFVALAADKVESPFRHKKGEQLGNAVAKTIPELWEGKQIKKEYWDMRDFKDSKVNKALKLYDELFNPEMTKRHVKRIESLEKLSDQQDTILNYADSIADDHKDYIKFQTESSNLIKNGILRKTTEEIEYYHSKLSEHNVLPLEVLTRLDGNKEQEAKDNVVSDTADDIDIDKV